MSATVDEKLVVTRIFDAPRERVFETWTEPGRLRRWWAPNGFSTPFCTVDLRPGGAFRYCMRSPEGRDYWGKGVYREIVRSERIVYLDTFTDAEGHSVPPTHYGMSADFPSETTVTVTFTEHGGRTTFRLQCSMGSASAAEREMCQQGWSQMLDRLAECLAGDGLKAQPRAGGQDDRRQFREGAGADEGPRGGHGQQGLGRQVRGGRA